MYVTLTVWAGSTIVEVGGRVETCVMVKVKFCTVVAEETEVMVDAGRILKTVEVTGSSLEMETDKETTVDAGRTEVIVVV
jgi:hypothetical protein